MAPTGSATSLPSGLNASPTFWSRTAGAPSDLVQTPSPDDVSQTPAVPLEIDERSVLAGLVDGCADHLGLADQETLLDQRPRHGPVECLDGLAQRGAARAATAIDCREGEEHAPLGIDLEVEDCGVR